MYSNINNNNNNNLRPGVEDLVAAAAGLGLGGVVVALRHHVVGRPVDLRRHACI